MAIIFNYNKEFKNTTEVVFDSTVLASVTKTFEKEGLFYSVLVENNQSLKVRSVFCKENSRSNLNIIFGFASESYCSSLINEISQLTDEKLNFNDNSNVLVGQIIKREQHPKSEKLFVLTVNFGGFKKTIITNTLYTTEGKYLAWYMTGSITPQGQEIKIGEVMGFTSEGMLCSASSLGLDKYKDSFENDVLSFAKSHKNEYLGKKIQDIYPELIFK
ncbi:TyrS-associated PheT N-terminal domain-related protein TapR [Mycoplasma zalophidermidis]|uniref:TyrS-associated PheT N-terminal domain-related protein TapR n=1 Tax=Mycoplasma zalophidermidis TaxID=398174 RepID=UPI00215D1216|nr:hypothetical protein [Mycoplasma zalophidermidis]MCR8966534.1 hypothetical protein [Mycoplasma zalophidermidis]